MSASTSATTTNASPPNKRQRQDKILGFIGLGKIGYALAKNICTKSTSNDSPAVTIQKAIHYDIDPELCAQFASEVSISTTASSVKDVAEQCDVLFTALPNDAILLSVVFGDDNNDKETKKKEAKSSSKREGINTYLKPNSIHISCSTVSPNTSRTISTAHATNSIQFVAAPIFARPDGLALGHATVPISSTNAHSLQIAKVLLERSATKVVEINITSDQEEEDAGAANVVKLAGNFLIASAIESISEAYTFCESQNVPRQTVHDLLSSTIFDCLIYKGYGQRIASRDHTPYPHAHFALDLGKKDVQLVSRTAEEVGVKMPTVDLLSKRFEEATTTTTAKGKKKKSRGDLDWSAIALSVSEDAGVDVEKYETWCRRENPKIDWKPPT